MLLRKVMPVLMVLAAALVSASPALAGPSIFAGLSAPTGDFGDAFKTGFHGGLAYTVPVTPLGSVGVRGAYNRFSLDSDVIDGHLNAIEVLAIGKLSLVSGPFFVAGVGFTNMKATIEDVSGDSNTDFTAAAGIGVKIVKFELTGMYHSISSEGSSTNYLTLSAGLGF